MGEKVAGSWWLVTPEVGNSKLMLKVSIGFQVPKRAEVEHMLETRLTHSKELGGARRAKERKRVEVQRVKSSLLEISNRRDGTWTESQVRKIW